jgi:hypothetical protein
VLPSLIFWLGLRTFAIDDAEFKDLKLAIAFDFRAFWVLAIPRS